MVCDCETSSVPPKSVPNASAARPRPPVRLYGVKRAVCAAQAGAAHSAGRAALRIAVGRAEPGACAKCGCFAQMLTRRQELADVFGSALQRDEPAAAGPCAAPRCWNAPSLMRQLAAALLRSNAASTCRSAGRGAAARRRDADSRGQRGARRHGGCGRQSAHSGARAAGCRRCCARARTLLSATRWLQRTAAASARVLLGRDAFQQVAENRVKKVRARAAGARAARLTCARARVTRAARGRRAMCWSWRSWRASTPPS
jgi:hypothetical protein